MCSFAVVGGALRWNSEVRRQRPQAESGPLGGGGPLRATVVGTRRGANNPILTSIIQDILLYCKIKNNVIYYK